MFATPRPTCRPQLRLEALEDRTALTCLDPIYEWPTSAGGNGHFYALTTTRSTWVQAEAEAVALGGHLVAVNSQAEQNFLASMFPGTTAEEDQYWIGFTDQASEGAFVWTTGEPVSYTNWYPGEPNNGGTGEDYGLLVPVWNWKWNDGNAVSIKWGIIE